MVPTLDRYHKLRIRFIRRVVYRVVGVSVTLAILLLVLLCITPIQATVLVPGQHYEDINSELNHIGISTIRSNAISFNAYYQRSLPGLGWRVWMNESKLFDAARRDGYYCEITYTPLIERFEWSASVGNSRMVGLQ